jgi:hypothetical protein
MGGGTRITIVCIRITEFTHYEDNGWTSTVFNDNTALTMVYINNIFHIRILIELL